MNDVNSYLERLSRNLTSSKEERDKINTSFNYLEGKIFEHFRDRINKVYLFGSYERGTELPASIFDESDVDVMVIFKSNEYQPDTFLKHLQEFADKVYPRSDVLPDHPAINISLNHIKFELIPAYYKNEFWNGDVLKIPAPRRKELKWINTDPEKLKKNLKEKNEKENGQILPLIKLIKYLNLIQESPYDSYKIEEFALSCNYSCKLLKDYFYKFIDELDTDGQTESQLRFIKELKKNKERLLLLEKNDMVDYAILELKKVLPVPETK